MLDHLVSVAGLAPARPCLKDRLRELLCIHGRMWSPRLVSRQRLLVFSEALICLSYPGKVACQAVAGERRLVVPRGNAPRSSGYQPGALLLNYETMVNCGFVPNRFRGRNTRFSLRIGRIRRTRFGL